MMQWEKLKGVSIKGFEENMKYRIKYGWMKKREASNVLCGKIIPIRLKSKFYKTVMTNETGNDLQNSILGSRQEYRTQKECSRDVNVKVDEGSNQLSHLIN